MVIINPCLDVCGCYTGKENGDEKGESDFGVFDVQDQEEGGNQEDLEVVG